MTNKHNDKINDFDYFWNLLLSAKASGNKSDAMMYRSILRGIVS